MQRQTLVEALNGLLDIQKFTDYCPNGLQIEGRAEIHRVMTAVTASQAVIDAAIAWQADALLVHHGYFWKGESPVIAGVKAQRISKLIKADINLLAYHLPLDAHANLGNNAGLALALGIPHWSCDDLVFYAQMFQPLGVAQLAEQLTQVLQRPPLVLGDLQKSIHRLAWCSGAAQDYLEKAAFLGADAFISGEVSERTFHLAAELGMVYFAAGHHATERFGVQALGDYMAKTWGLTVQFCDENNPI